MLALYSWCCGSLMGWLVAKPRPSLVTRSRLRHNPLDLGRLPGWSSGRLAMGGSTGDAFTSCRHTIYTSLTIEVDSRRSERAIPPLILSCALLTCMPHRWHSHPASTPLSEESSVSLSWQTHGAALVVSHHLGGAQHQLQVSCNLVPAGVRYVAASAVTC